MVKKLMNRLTNNFGLKILAVLFSMVLWLVVVNIDDPKTTKTFTTKVNVENSGYLAGIGKYYEIVNNSDTVTFKVSGKRSYLERISSTDFRAVADLETIEDFSRVPIEISPQRYSGNVTVSSKNYYMEVAVEELLTDPIMISVEATGDVAEQNALGEVSASPTILRVSGPVSAVKKIGKVVARIDVEGMSEDMTDSVIPILYDEDGKEADISELTFNSQSVLVTAKILNTKEVTLNFQTTGTPPEGYEYLGTEYTPQTVKIKGESSVLNTINSVTIPPEVIDLTDASDDITKTIDITSYLPEKVSLVDSGKGKINLLVKIEKHEVRTFEVPTANITASNLSNRYDVKFLEDTVKVEIEGLTSMLDDLDASTLTGTIDASGMTSGEHTINLMLNLENKLSMAKPATVTVDIVKAEENTSDTGTTSNKNNTLVGNTGASNESETPADSKKEDEEAE